MDRSKAQGMRQLFQLLLREEQNVSCFIRAGRSPVHKATFDGDPVSGDELFRRLVISANHSSLEQLQAGRTQHARRICEDVIAAGSRGIVAGAPLWHAKLLLDPLLNIGRLAAAQGDSAHACDVYRSFLGCVVEGRPLILGTLRLKEKDILQSYANHRAGQPITSLYKGAYEIYFIESIRALLSGNNAAEAASFLTTFEPGLLTSNGWFDRLPSLLAELRYLVAFCSGDWSGAESALQEIAAARASSLFTTFLVKLYRLELADQEAGSPHSTPEWCDALQWVFSQTHCCSAAEREGIGYLVGRAMLSALCASPLFPDAGECAITWSELVTGEWPRLLLLIAGIESSDSVSLATRAAYRIEELLPTMRSRYAQATGCFYLSLTHAVRGDREHWLVNAKLLAARIHTRAGWQLAKCVTSWSYPLVKEPDDYGEVYKLQDRQLDEAFWETINELSAYKWD